MEYQGEELLYRYDTQMLIEGKNLNEENIKKEIITHIKGDSLLVVGDSDLIKVHYHTNEPWEILKKCANYGEIYDIIIEDMFRQSKGMQG